MGAAAEEEPEPIVVRVAEPVSGWRVDVARRHAPRWAAAGMLTAATQIRRVKGHRQLLELARALRHAVHTDQPSTIAVTA
jgi:hypothetical protein